MPIIVLFFQDNGLNMQEVFWIQSTYAIIIAATELLSGYFADMNGRSLSMKIGMLLNLMGITGYAFAHSFWQFIPCAVLLGLGQSFVSGSDTALMFDSLNASGKSKAFIKLEGRSVSVGNFSEAVAAILGGFLANYCLRMPFYFQIIVALIGWIFALFIKEPPTSKYILSDKGWKNIFNILHYSLIKKKVLRWNIIFSSFLGVSTLIMAWLVQPLLKHFNFTTYSIGISWSILNIITGIAAFYAFKIKRYFNYFKMNVFLLSSIILGYLMISTGYKFISLTFLLFFYFIRGIATPMLRDFINRITPSEMRATVMSIRSMIIRSLFFIFSPFLGYLYDVYSLKFAILGGSLIFGILGIINLSLLYITLKKD
ncbi:MAG: MFS transporter [Vicingaceae bacterium]